MGGYAGSVSTLIVALSAPLLGTLADRRNMKPILFTASLALGALGCACLGLAWGWMSFLVIFVVAKVGYSSANVFYDAMLPEITTEARMDKVSSLGYAFGYIGSCIPFIVSIVIVLFYEKLGISQPTAMLIAFLITAVWWVVLTVPLLRTYRHTAYSEASGAKLSKRCAGSSAPSRTSAARNTFSFLCWRFFSSSTACTRSSRWRRPTAQPWGSTRPACCSPCF